MLALDTETARFAPGAMSPPITCVSWAMNSDCGLWHVSDAYRPLRAALESDVPIVGQYFAYDAACIIAEWPDLTSQVFAAYDAGRVHDTRVREYLVDTARGTISKRSLDDLSRRYLARALDKSTFRLGYGDLRGVPLDRWPEGARQYAVDDARATLDVYRAQEAVHDARLFVDEARKVRAEFALHLVNVHGVYTDPNAVALFERMYRERGDTLEKSLIASGLVRPGRVTRTGKRVEPSRSLKEVARIIAEGYTAQGKPTPLTEKGNVRTDEEVCLGACVPVLAEYAEYSSVRRALTETVPLLISGTVTPIHARYT